MAARERLARALGGAARLRIITVFACVLGLSSADVATVGASATQLRHSLGINNTALGLLVTVTALVSALASLPFGMLADRVRRTRSLGVAVACWGAAMIWCAAASGFTGLLLARLLLGIVTAAAGPMIASLVGDYFPGRERGRIYGYILAGELMGAGFGFGISGNLASLSWRAAFVALAVPAFPLGWLVTRLHEPARGGSGVLLPEGTASQATGAEKAESDAQRLAREQGPPPDAGLALHRDPRRMNLLQAARYVLRVRTNVVLIVASACGYYFLAGVETFGTEFVRQQYGIGQGLATVGLLSAGIGAIGGVLAGGRAGDALLHREYLTGRIMVSAVAATATVLLAVPALLTRSFAVALPFLMLTACCLAAQNPPLDAARLDIMPAQLWGRAEAVRTGLRSLAQAAAPLLFGLAADHLAGGGQAGLQWAFVVMLAPLAAGAALLYRALRSYPADVATAAAAPAAASRAGAGRQAFPA